MKWLVATVFTLVLLSADLIQLSGPSRADAQLYATGSTLSGNCAVTSLGEVKCWGQYAQVPNDLGKVTQISANAGRVCAVTYQQALRCWGQPWRLTNPPTNLSLVAQVAVAEESACALTSQGTVTCWGSDRWGRYPPEGWILGKVTQIAAGSRHLCAINEKRIINCWGSKVSGDQENLKWILPSSDLGTVESIFSGGGRVCVINDSDDLKCLRADGANLKTLGKASGVAMSGAQNTSDVCWVNEESTISCNWYNLVIPNDFGKVSQISGSSSGVCAVSITGKLDCWGSGFGAQDIPPNDIGRLLGKKLNSITPILSGSFKPGGLVCATTEGADSNISFTYDWYVGMIPRQDAKGSCYQLTLNDAPSGISVKLNASKPGYEVSVFESRQYPTVGLNLSLKPTPKLLGISKVGQTISVSAGKWDAGVKLQYQWLRNNVAIPRAVAPKYKLTAADKGKNISIRVTGYRPGFQMITKVAAAIKVR
jgi:hypothetical protein